MRLFAALAPPSEVLEHLAGFLEPRLAAGRAAGLRWSDPEQWHVTLAFAAGVEEWRVEEVEQRLAALASRSAPIRARVAGGGAFPDPARAKIMWAGLSLEGEGPAALERLARGARTALATAGAEVDGARFRPHLTLARRNRAGRVDDWVRLLDAYRGPVGTLDHVTLIASHLGEGPRGRPRHEVLTELPLGG